MAHGESVSVPNHLFSEECFPNHRVKEHHVGRVLKDHLVQPFLAKALSQKCPAKVSSVREITASLARLFQCLIGLNVKNFLCLSN